jgi:uncharacterized membrane protein YdjX (TVP38/TMEM64 family)
MVERTNNNRKLLLMLLGAVAVGIAFLFLPIKSWVLPLQEQVRALGPIAPLVVIIGYVALTALLIPGSALTLVAGGAFGLWKGLLVVVIAANLAAAFSFVLARTFLRKQVARWAAENPKFAALDRAVGKQGFRMVLLSRLSPVFPFTLLNYLLGLTKVRFGSYVLANLIGMLPGTFLYVYLGATAQKALQGNMRIIPTLIGLVATVAVVVMVARIARRAMREAELETQSEGERQPRSD